MLVYRFHEARVQLRGSERFLLSCNSSNVSDSLKFPVVKKIFFLFHTYIKKLLKVKLSSVGIFTDQVLCNILECSDTLFHLKCQRLCTHRINIWLDPVCYFCTVPFIGYVHFEPCVCCGIGHRQNYISYFYTVYHTDIVWSLLQPSSGCHTRMQRIYKQLHKMHNWCYTWCYT